MKKTKKEIYAKWRTKHLAAERSRVKKWSESHPEYFADWRKKNRIKLNERNKRYRLKNIEKVKEGAKKFYLSHKDYFRNKSKQYHRNHPEVTRWYTLKKRSRDMDMPFVVTRQEFSEWHLKQPVRCAYCDISDPTLGGKTTKNLDFIHFSIDRMNPELPYALDNMCFACWTCNRCKSDIFNYKEWRDIAQRHLKPKWMKRLGLEEQNAAS